MVELVQHLRFVERQITARRADEDVALQATALRSKLLRSPEVMGVVGHVKEAF